MSVTSRSQSQHRQDVRALKEAKERLAAVRREALAACRRDPFGVGTGMDSERVAWIGEYLLARHGVQHISFFVALPVVKCINQFA